MSGVSVGVKDMFATSDGASSSCGSRMLKGELVFEHSGSFADWWADMERRR